MRVNGLTKKAIHLLSAVVFLLLSWQVLSFILDTPVFPPPFAAFTSLFHSMNSDLMIHLKVSFYRIAVSLIIATIVGVPMGLWIGKNKRVDAISAPLIYLTYPVPKIVFLPVFLILMGIGNVSKIVMITLIVFYQILVTTRDAAKNLQKEYILSVRSLRANERDLYFHVYFPACLPAILTSLRLGLGTAMAVLFLVETYATREGIGFYIMDSWSSLAYEQMFAGIIAMGLMGFLIYLLLDACEKILCSWVNP
ncbi:MAG: ABC transporter permease [Peptococcaceae bacterium]|nr:ABC transporter permease [Peptococcaceae bacterium]